MISIIAYVDTCTSWTKAIQIHEGITVFISIFDEEKKKNYHLLLSSDVMKIQGGIKPRRIFQSGILYRLLCSLLLNGTYGEVNFKFIYFCLQLS